MNKNNDDLNDDFDNSPDIDTDFGEFDQETERGSLGDVIKKNPAVKIGLVVAGLLVIVGAITLFGGSSEKAPNSTVSAGNDLKETPGTNELSPEMRQVIEEANQQKLEAAQNQGSSFMPQPIDTAKNQLTVPAEEATSEDPLARWRDIQNERLKAEQAQQVTQQEVQDPAKQQAAQALVASMSAQMNEILSGKKIDNLKTMQVTNLQDLLAAQQKLSGATQTAQPNATSASVDGFSDPNSAINSGPPAKTIVPAGAIEYGQLLIEANSDIPGPVVSMIVSGPFAGSRVIGTFQRSQEYLVIQFKTLIDKKGVSIPIDAYALDPDTTLTGMATDVDRRYWQRIILPAAADFIEGVSEAYANNQGTTTVVTGDVVVQDQPTIDFEEQLASGLERASERAGEILEQEGNNTQPLVRVRAGTPMGILFMSPVTDQDQLAGINNPVTARIRAEQEQQNFLQQQLQQGNPAQSPVYLLQGMQGAQNLQNGQTSANTINGTTYNGAAPTGYSNGYSTGYSNSNTSVNNNNGRYPTVFSTRDYLGNSR